MSKSVERGLLTMAQVFRLSRMYPESHPAVAGALRDVSAALPALVEQGPVECGIKPQGFLWERVPLQSRNPALAQLAQLLYSRGVRSVVFHPGVTLDHVKALLRVATGHLGPDDPGLGSVEIVRGTRTGSVTRRPPVAADDSPFRPTRSSLVFRPDALPTDIEARRLLPPFATGGDPVERMRSLKRLAEMTPDLLALREPQLTAEVLAALDRCIANPREPELAEKAREVSVAIVDDGLLTAMVRRLAEPRLPEEERRTLVHGLAAVIESVCGVMADAYLGAAPEARASYMAVMRAAGERGVFPLLKRLSGSGAEIAAAAADLLGATGSDTAYERLSRAVRDDSPLVRERALQAMTEIGGGDLTRVAAPLLRDPEPAVRNAAARAIGSQAASSGVTLLLARLASEENEDVLIELLWALGQTRDPRVVQSVAEFARPGGALTRKPSRVRVAAAQALATAGTPEARAVLAELAEDREPEVRAVATGGRG